MKFFTIIWQYLLLATCFFFVGVGFTNAASTDHGLNITDQSMNIPLFNLLPLNVTQYFKIAELVITGDINSIKLNHTGHIEKVLFDLGKEFESFNLTAFNNKLLAEIEAREEAYRTETTCLPIKGMNWAMAKSIPIAAAIKRLLQGNMLCSVPGRTCVRLACINGSAIWLCNNNEYGISHPCSQFADFAQAIKDICGPQGSQQGEKMFGGQAYDSNNWYLLIMATSHC
ncbi:uncharacterized protein RSE6_02858 [Rhynchosporium secalis]|uniref:Secreted protein n=1 Tax=Rhynchosporium secalis TaxID=38038 RepID=A0A1E1M1D0_RHYSE|nr:uncharacterized protein RSE6_02858 [Rhynchosporium secalis]